MYFEKPGKQNTAETLRLAVNTVKERNIKYVVLATVTGYTGECFPAIDGVKVVCVTHANGYGEAGVNELSDEKKKLIEAKGHTVYTSTHVLSGVERSLSNDFRGAYPVEVMAHTLRMFGQGTKVCVEIATMAADAGLIPPGVPIVSIGGTGRGADTAVIMRAGHANHIFNTKIDEIICKPVMP